MHTQHFPIRCSCRYGSFCTRLQVMVVAEVPVCNCASRKTQNLLILDIELLLCGSVIDPLIILEVCLGPRLYIAPIQNPSGLIQIPYLLKYLVSVLAEQAIPMPCMTVMVKWLVMVQTSVTVWSWTAQAATSLVLNVAHRSVVWTVVRIESGHRIILS